MTKEFWLRYLKRLAIWGSLGSIIFLVPGELSSKVFGFLTIPFLIMMTSLIELGMVNHYRRLKDLEPPPENLELWDPEHPTRRGYRAQNMANEDDVA